MFLSKLSVDDVLLYMGGALFSIIGYFYRSDFDCKVEF